MYSICIYLYLSLIGDFIGWVLGKIVMIILNVSNIYIYSYFNKMKRKSDIQYIYVILGYYDFGDVFFLVDIVYLIIIIYLLLDCRNIKNNCDLI
jgi:hypothetical protein